ncbi:MAG TPA: recombinase family protein [Solirubrobacterales bacterium]|jgi:DNA invertase Pin-like site-specific DNA recombinase/ribosomal protein L44E|nr:recombinase family protein [Solirubrobacterales bacterium]
MQTYVAVVRVSFLGRRKADSEKFHADEDQIREVKAWGAMKNVRVVVLEPELNVSGGLPIEQRPRLMEAIEGVERGQYAGIVVAYLSRLGRSVSEQLKTWSRVEAAGGQIVTIKEGVDTTTASGRLHRNLLISIDAHEREQHAERFEALREFATKAGVWQRRQLPRGYLKGPTRRLQPDPERGPEVTEGFGGIPGGRTISSLADEWAMTYGGVRALLRNRVYLGELHVGRYVNKKAHPALVDPRTFDETQRELSGHPRPTRSRDREVALLAGVIRCAACGHVMTRTSVNKYGTFNYLCPGRHSGACCPKRAAIGNRVIEPYVEAVAKSELDRLEIAATATGASMAEAEAALRGAEGELDAYLDAVSAAVVGADSFAAGARKRSDEVEAAKGRFYAEAARRPKAPAGGTGAAIWDTLGQTERNTLLRSLLAAVIVRQAGRKGGGIPVEERARVVAFGTELGLPRNRGHIAMGIVPIFPNSDDEGVLTIASGEYPLQAASSAA